MRGGAFGNMVVIDAVDYTSKDDLLYALRDAEDPIKQRLMDLQEETWGDNVIIVFPFKYIYSIYNV